MKSIIRMCSAVWDSFCENWIFFVGGIVLGHILKHLI